MPKLCPNIRFPHQQDFFPIRSVTKSSTSRFSHENLVEKFKIFGQDFVPIRTEKNRPFTSTLFTAVDSEPVAPVAQRYLVTLSYVGTRVRSRQTVFFSLKKLKKKKKMPNGWRTIKSLVHKIRPHGRRGKGMVESFSREK